MGEDDSEHGESWHRSVRARVTALKCHVMAAQGLTPEGKVGPAYNADVLLKQPHNANILKQHENVADIEAYVAAALEGTNLKPTETNSSSSNSSTSSASTIAALHSDQVCLEMLPTNASCSTDNENNEIIFSNDDDVKLSQCDKTVRNQVTSTSSSSVPYSCCSSVPSANLDNVNSSSCVVNNNCESGHLDSDIGCQQRWPWKATFESDNEDENDHHEKNGYMPICGECDERDEPSSPQPLANKEAPSKLGSSSAIGMASKGSPENTKEEENDLKCIEGKSDCSCCATQRSRLKELKLQLHRQEKEIQSLTNIRTEVENELQELTANLFQEAHKMVSAANQRTACAEKSLKEAQMAVDVLSGEVTALKAMVITSTPATPNPHLHPQLTCNSSRSAAGGIAVLSSDAKAAPAAALLASSGISASAPSSTSASSSTGLRLFQRGHKKSPSDFDLKYGRDITPPSSPFKGGLFRPSESDQRQRSLLDCDAWEVDPTCHREFVSWHQSGDMDPSSTPFMQRMYEEDINLCLGFPNAGLSHAVLRAVQENELFIEELNVRHQHAAATRCVLLEVARFCKYRFRLGLREPYTWYYISQLARNRIIAVCDFLNYLRYIKQGLVKSSIHETYWEVVKLRRQMAVARLGF